MNQLASALSFVEPFWWARTMFGETVIPVADKPGGGAVVKLAFTPLAMPMIRNCTQAQTYQAGRDFHWQLDSREIHIPSDSRITVLTQDQLYRPANSQKHGLCRDRDNDILFATKDEYHQLQTEVTYTFDPGDWQAPKTMQPTHALPRTASQLAQADHLSVVLLGDSISVGANASGMFDVPPNMPPYGQLFCNAMIQQFGRPVNLVNLSVGGKNSQWGLEQIDEVIKHQPDLVILAFGMNDASGDCAPEKFQSQIQQHIDAIKEKLPESEFILVASMAANAQWVHARPALYPQYRDALAALQCQGVVLADVYSLWQEMVARKNYLDFTGNGLNHPNDFGQRLYAQVLWSTLIQATKIKPS
ncbi:MAG: SGNH/GDSL hydrolase family protein [Phycisphaeraceae bacterium]|nr:SGNH/GDSL hydrolase family protein [Phycisphaeraceae bacterium]